MINRFRVVFLATFVSLAGCQATEMSSSSFHWPDYQAGLAPSASNSTIKAMLPPVMLAPAADKTAPELAAFGGVWEGWRCPNKAVDTKIAVREVTNDGATVDYAAGGSFGTSNAMIAVRYSGDVLRGTINIGGSTLDFILGMRSDGHMNVKIGPCTGIMRQTEAPPKN